MPIRQPPRRPGFEPAFGQPDPNDPSTVGAPPRARITHYADGGRSGPVCGIRPTPSDASAYDPSDPTCPECADWLQKTRAHTERVHGKTIAANEAMREAVSGKPSKAKASSASATPTPATPPAGTEEKKN